MTDPRRGEMGKEHRLPTFSCEDLSAAEVPVEGVGGASVGPEPGVSAAERRRCLDAVFKLIFLGPSSLRFEPAAVTAVGLVAAALAAERRSE